MRRSPKDWRWVSAHVIFSAHDRMLSLHGGSSGIRDVGMIESALAKPQNLANYEEPDAAELAAAYAFGLIRNHGFVDGNKRIGWLAANLFLSINGYAFHCEDAVLIISVQRVASGSVTQEEFAAWIRERLEKLSD